MRSQLVRRSGLVVGILALGLAACSWDRFDALRSNAPIQPLESPGKTDDYGASVAGVFDGKRAFGLGLGRQNGGPGATYDLGIEENPTTSKEREDVCATVLPKQSCSPAKLPVGLSVGYSGTTPHKACFTFGSGTYEERAGILSLCADNTYLIHPIPEALLERLVTPIASQEETNPLVLAANRSDTAHLLAGVGAAGSAFFYRPATDDPIELSAGEAALDSFGEGVAVLGSGGEAVILAVSAPNAGELWLFRDEAGALTPLGCERLEAGDGATLAAGDVDGDGFDDLAIGARGRTTVKGLRGADLFALGAMDAPSCSLTLASTSLLVSFTCKETEAVKGCAGGDFASSLAIFDTDGDGKGEIAVGAPKMDAGSKKEAGAVLVYSGSGKLLGASYRGDAPEKAHYGASIGAVAQKDRDVLVVGEPGSNTVGVTYCAGVTSGDVSPRCPPRASE